jgi:hypothetical protein
MAKPARQTLFQLESLSEPKPGQTAEVYNISRDESGRLFCNCKSFIFGKVRQRDGSRGCKHTQIIRLAMDLSRLPEIQAAALEPFKADTGTGEPARRVYFDDSE